MTGDANRAPRRWRDRSSRVRVIEGWHPSQPDRLGYNLLIDDDWIGTFETLDRAAREAASHMRAKPSQTRIRRIALLAYIQPGDR